MSKPSTGGSENKEKFILHAIKNNVDYFQNREDILQKTKSLLGISVESVYEGDFISNKKCGEGILFCEKKTFSGIFMDDKFIKGKIITDNEEKECILKDNNLVFISDILDDYKKQTEIIKNKEEE